MTVVIGMLTDNFIAFAGDQRRTSTVDESEYYDDMRKHFKVNDNVIVGFSGDYGLTLQTALFITEHKNIDSMNVDEIAIKLQKYLTNIYEVYDDIQQTIYVGGKDKDGKISLVNMSQRDGFETLDKITPKSGELKWNFCYAHESPLKHIEKSINELIENGEVLTIAKTQEIAKYAIEQVSKKDKYVSETVDLDFIAI